MWVFVSRRERASALRWSVAVAVALGVGYLASRRYAPFLTDPEALRAWVEGFGPWAPVAFVGLQAVQVVVAPIPGQAVGLLGGYLFGALWGGLYSVVGVAIGSAVVFWLSRRYGRRYVEDVVAAETLARFDGLARESGRTGLFLAFLVPGLPDDVICFVGGLTEMPLWQLVALAAVGRAPSFFLVALIGAELADARFASAALLGVALAAVALAGYLHRGRLAGWAARQ